MADGDLASPIALVPARTNSQGIPNKNWRPLASDGRSATELAVACAWAAGVQRVVVTSDGMGVAGAEYLKRPDHLATSESSMIDVVKHALGEIPGPSDQIILLVQPTQPLRQPKHLKAAIQLLESSGADSVVSVVEIPAIYHPRVVFEVTRDGELERYNGRYCSELPRRRQDLEPAFIRDGTCYAFRRATVEEYGNIYGQTVMPLIIPSEETCSLDSMSDWYEAERRLKEREHA